MSKPIRVYRSEFEEHYYMQSDYSEHDCRKYNLSTNCRSFVDPQTGKCHCIDFINPISKEEYGYDFDDEFYELEKRILENRFDFIQFPEKNEETMDEDIEKWAKENNIIWIHNNIPGDNNLVKAAAI